MCDERAPPGFDAATGQNVRVTTSKEERRRRAIDQRTARRSDRHRLDQSICSGIVAWLAGHDLGPRSVIVRYAALPGEPDVQAVEAALPQLRFALTRTPEVGFDLSVHPADSVLETHRFGYDQPVSGSPSIDDDEIAAVLVPGLAFDRRGTRLGFGAGFFDRFLARLGPIVRMGICDEISDESLPVEAHDIAMTHLATPAGVVAVMSATR